MRRRPAIGPVAWLGCLALGLLVACPALAAPAWLAPEGLSPGGEDANYPQVATGSGGDATAVWQQKEGTHFVIQAATRPPGGAWSAPIDVSAPGKAAELPLIAIDEEGEATVLWEQQSGGHGVVVAATRPPGGAWSAPVDVSAPGQNAENPRLAIDPQGEAVAVWQRYEGIHSEIQAATRPPGGAWSAPIDLSVPGEGAFYPEVAAGPQGALTAVWQHAAGSDYMVQAATRPPGGAWSAPIDLSVPGGYAVYPRVVVDSSGNATAVWWWTDGGQPIVQAAGRPPGGAWSAPVDLSASGQESVNPQAFADAHGVVTVVWQTKVGGHFVVEAATHAPGGAWSAPTDLSAAGQSAYVPQVVADPLGSVVVVWSSTVDSDHIIEAATRPAGGGWSAPISLSAPGGDAYNPQLATDSWGDAIAVWEREEGSHSVAQAAAYDPAGPQLGALSIPARGQVGVPVPFSVSPFDVWSGLGQTSWSFGDGATATGAGVEHAYARAGTYEVALTAADAVGNPTTAAATIAVTAPSAHAAGRAYAARLAEVRRGRARLKLRCREGDCAGFVKLTARGVLRHPGRGAKIRAVALGGSSFTIPNGRAKVLAVKLRGRAGKLIRNAGRKGLKVRLGGSGVQGRAVRLKPAAKPRRGHRSARNGNRFGGKRWVFSTR